VDVTLSGTDPEGSALSYAIAAQPTNGSVALNNNIVTYTPNDGYAGADSFTFTVNDGALTSGAATVTLTVQAASKFQGEVNKPDGADVPSPIITAMDSDGNEVITVTGETDGTFLLNALTDQPLTLKFTAQGFADQVIPVIMPAEQSTTLPIDVIMIERGAEQTLDIDAGGSLSGDNGASVTVAAGSFVDANGAAVTGNIQIQITPVDVSNPEILAAFPGDFTGLEELNNTETAIASLGTVEYNFTQNGNALQLNSGATAEIQLPIYGTTNPKTGNPVAMGDVIELWSLNEDTGIWLQEGTGTVVANTDAPGGLALQATVSHFTWWNIDVPIPTADVEVTLSGTATGGAAVIHARAPSDFGGYRTANRNVFVGGTTTGLSIPADRETCFWIEYVDLSGATAISDEQCVDNAIENSTYPLTFNVITAGALALNRPYTRSSYFVDRPLGFNFSPGSLETSVSYTITGTLPTGLSFMPTSATTARIIGTPTETGSFPVTIEGTDSESFTDSESLTIRIIDTPPPSLRNVATLYGNVGDPLSRTISLNNNGADDPTSWIVTQADGSAVPAGVTISSSGVFSVDNFDGVDASYLVTAYNSKGASNAVTISVLDVATSPPILRSTYFFTQIVDFGVVPVNLAGLNSGAPASSWTVTNTDGTAVAAGVSISSSGVLTVPDKSAGTVDQYDVLAFNGTLSSNAMRVTIDYDFDPFIDPDPCPGSPGCGFKPQNSETEK